jgi:hypothetical protein
MRAYDRFGRDQGAIRHRSDPFSLYPQIIQKVVAKTRYKSIAVDSKAKKQQFVDIHHPKQRIQYVSFIINFGKYLYAWAYSFAPCFGPRQFSCEWRAPCAGTRRGLRHTANPIRQTRPRPLSLQQPPWIAPIGGGVTEELHPGDLGQELERDDQAVRIPADFETRPLGIQRRVSWKAANQRPDDRERDRVRFCLTYKTVSDINIITNEIELPMQTLLLDCIIRSSAISREVRQVLPPDARMGRLALVVLVKGEQ